MVNSFTRNLLPGSCNTPSLLTVRYFKPENLQEHPGALLPSATYTGCSVGVKPILDQVDYILGLNFISALYRGSIALVHTIAHLAQAIFTKNSERAQAHWREVRFGLSHFGRAVAAASVVAIPILYFHDRSRLAKISKDLPLPGGIWQAKDTVNYVSYSVFEAQCRCSIERAELPAGQVRLLVGTVQIEVRGDGELMFETSCDLNKKVTKAFGQTLPFKAPYHLGYRFFSQKKPSAMSALDPQL